MEPAVSAFGTRCVSLWSILFQQSVWALVVVTFRGSALMQLKRNYLSYGSFCLWLRPGVKGLATAERQLSCKQHCDSYLGQSMAQGCCCTACNPIWPQAVDELPVNGLHRCAGHIRGAAMLTNCQV
jgi:hypothetical protein